MDWVEFLSLAESYGPTIGGIAAGIVLIALVFKSWPVISKIVKVGDAVADLPETLHTITTEIKTIKQEVLPNGGTSLRDAVNRTEHQIKIIAAIVAEHEEEINH